MRGLRDLRRSLTRGERDRASQELGRSASNASGSGSPARDLLHRSAHGGGLGFALGRNGSSTGNPPGSNSGPASHRGHAMSPSHSSHAVDARAPPQLIIQATTSSTSPIPLGYIPFKAGDFFHVQHEPPPGADWFEAADPIHGAAGKVPQSCFTVLTRTSRQSNTPSLPLSPGGTAMLSRTSTGMSMHSPTTPQPHPSTTHNSTSRGLLAQVRYPFTAERPDEMSVSEGDEVLVLAHSNKEWYIARPLPPATGGTRERPGQPTASQLADAGRIGLLPAAFVSLCDTTWGRTLAEHEVDALIFAGVIPPVNEWKRRMAAYSQSQGQAHAQAQAQAQAQGQGQAQSANQTQAHTQARDHATQVQHERDAQAQAQAQPAPPGAHQHQYEQPQPLSQPSPVDTHNPLPTDPAPAGVTPTSALIEGADPTALLAAGVLPPGGSPLPTGMVTNARVDGVHFEQGDYWYRVRATHLSWPALPAAGPSRGLRLAHGGTVPARPRDDEDHDGPDEEEEDDLEGIDDLAPPRTDDDPVLPDPPEGLPSAQAGQVRELILYRLYEDFYEFHIALLDYYPQEAALGQAAAQQAGVRASSGSNVSASAYNASLPKVDHQGRAHLPLMPGPVPRPEGQDDQAMYDATSEQRAADLNLYISQLAALPLYIARSELVRLFFEPRPGDACQVVKSVTDPLAQSGPIMEGYAFGSAPLANDQTTHHLAYQMDNTHLDPVAPLDRSSSAGNAATDPAQTNGDGMAMTRNWSMGSGASASWLPTPTASGAGAHAVHAPGTEPRDRGSHNTSHTSTSTKSWGSAASFKAAPMARGATGASATTSHSTAGSTTPAPPVPAPDALKVKVLHISTGDVVALRVPRSLLLDQLVQRVCDRLALSDTQSHSLVLRYNPLNPSAPATATDTVDLVPLDSDEALARWADGRTKLTLFASEQ